MTDAEGAYVVSVRELCEFAAKRGDLDRRFTPAPTADEGLAGHKAVAARRGPAHRAEVRLEGGHAGVRVRGRADGFDPVRGVVEEVKTFRGDLAAMAANKRALHWAQAKVYAALLCRQLGLPALRVQLVYFDVESEHETVLEERCEAAGLADFLSGLCLRFSAWAGSEMAHRRARDSALRALVFVHPHFRPGQRSLAENTYKAVRAGRCLVAQAGTGIGKTLATLFAMLKAVPADAVDKVCYLTAKASGQGPPLAALAAIAGANPGLPLRVLQLVARDKACEHPDKACHGDACPLARGFYDRLPGARQAAVAAAAQAPLGQDALREVALANAVCPYYLAQELVRWADVVVADYNYQFDASALLHGMAQANGWSVALLVDEAHNLVERGRAMYTAALSTAALRAALRAAPAALASPLRRVRRAWPASARLQTGPHAAHGDVPAALLAALRVACAAIDAHWAVGPAAVPDPALLDWYFKMLAFVRLAETFGSHSVFDIELAPASGRVRDSTLAIRNVIPGPFLQPRFAAARTTVLFSATVSPPQFYADMLGLPADTAWLDVESPFGAHQLQVRVVTDIPTRFAQRAASAAPIAALIADQFERRPGNYLAFFSSFDHLQQVLQAFEALAPGVPAWPQARHMAPAQRQAFLDRFVAGGSGVGFVVLGGSFGEGVDLPGDRLVGAFIATLGLPQLNPVNEQMRHAMQRQFGRGFDYAYLYPGLRKVVQAAGRVVRTPSDRGVVVLIDERYAMADVVRLLPAWWPVHGADVGADAAKRRGPAVPA